MSNGDVSAVRERGSEDKPCHFVHFGLIVTGKGERDNLPGQFRALMATGLCTFKVVRRIGQRSPITSEKRKIEMVGRGNEIPPADTEEIGLPARTFLDADPCHMLILIDDLEYERRPIKQEVFDRYRQALDQLLNDEERSRASVHFLVNMLEAYFLADTRAMNSVLGLAEADYAGDVEEIRNPKGKIKKRYPSFKEVADGGPILDQIEVAHVLANPETCASLRALFAWCVRVLEKYSRYEALPDTYHLVDGCIDDITGAQLGYLSRE